MILAKTAMSPIFRNFWRHRSFRWRPLYLLYHLNLVILAKTAISTISRNFLLLRANLDMLICNKHAFYALGAWSPAHICTIRTKRRLCLPRAQSLNLSLGALVLKDVNF